VVVVALYLVVTRAPGWPRTRETFFSWEDARDSLPSVLDGLWLNVRLMFVCGSVMGFARQVADQVCFLDGGRILERGTPDEVFGAPREERTRRFLRRVVEAGRL
jgi:ABC-type sulfate/molybdate transport systems ATPase subunit